MNRLAAEVALVLAMKCAVLWLLWWASFSEPLARHMRVEPAHIERQFMPPAQPEAGDG